MIVIRDAGGLGDIIRIFPILDALSRMLEVTFCTDRVYAALCHLCPSIADGRVKLQLWDVKGVRSSLGPRIRAWIQRAGHDYMTGEFSELEDVVDLFCPALRHEVETRGRPTMDRVECWARAAGINDPVAIDMLRPKVHVDAMTRARGFDWLVDLPGRKAPIVALSPSSNASIRTYRNGTSAHGRTGRMGALIALLHKKGIRTVAFHSDKVDVPADYCSIDRDVRVQAGRLAVCDAFVGPDSGFLHLACALGLPSVGIFGPTDGRLVLKPYENLRIILQGDHDKVRTTIGCRHPCYGLPAGGYKTVCGGSCGVLESIPEEVIAGSVESLLAKPRSLRT